jgi:hypothetical protein
VWNENKIEIDTDNNYESGSTVKIIVEEQWSEPKLTGKIRIISIKTGYDTGELDLIWDGTNEYYYFDWNTNDLKPSDDYSIESTLADVWGNLDSDGLTASPDLTIILVDTTPPKQAQNLYAAQDQVDKTKVYLSWESSEKNVSGIIYRSTSSIDNIYGLEPIAEVTGANLSYLDILPNTPGEYYYAIFLKDEYGNLNYSITDTNLQTVTLPEDYIEKPKDDEPEDVFYGLGYFGLIVFIFTMIIFITLVIAYFVVNRKRKEPDSKSNEDIEDWSAIAAARKTKGTEKDKDKPKITKKMKKRDTKEQESITWKRPGDYEDSDFDEDSEFHDEDFEEITDGEEEWEEEDFGEGDDDISWFEE